VDLECFNPPPDQPIDAISLIINIIMAINALHIQIARLRERVRHADIDQLLDPKKVIAVIVDKLLR
jgi:hypothetical protein